MLDLKAFFKRRHQCVGFGEVLFDVFAGRPVIGGAPANFACMCRQLGLPSVVISAVGGDKLGLLARDLLAERLLPALMPQVEQETGHVDVTVDAAGVPSYAFIADPAYEHIPLSDSVQRVCAAADVFCYSTLVCRGTRSRETLLALLHSMEERPVLRIFDVNLRNAMYTSELLRTLLKYADIVKCNEDELPVLCSLAGIAPTAEAYQDYLRTHGIDALIYTCGEEGSTVFLNGECSELPTPKVNVVDTVGAGDAFTAAFISTLLQSGNLRDSHLTAVKTAAYVCTQQGAMPLLPEDLH